MEVLFFFFAFMLILLGLIGLIWMSDCDLLLLWKFYFGKPIESYVAGKTIWITGASSGIGEYLAYELAVGGARLVLSARQTDELERVKRECVLRSKLTEANILVIKLDVLDLDSHSVVLEKILQHFGQIDILVNNAGRTQRGTAADTSIEVMRQIIELNALSVFSLTKTVLPYMIQRKQGHIVVTSSLAGKSGALVSASYSASKFAVHGWFDALRTEQYENNINVTMVCPGPVYSNITRQAFTEVPGESYGQDIKATEKRMSTQRCAELMAVAIANQMYEVWISPNPPLAFVYLAQYCPSLAIRVARFIGMKSKQRSKESQH